MRIQIKKYFRNIDMPLLVSVLLLITIGIILIGSATHANVPGPKRYSFVLRQLSFAGINLVLGAFLALASVLTLWMKTMLLRHW